MPAGQGGARFKLQYAYSYGAPVRITEIAADPANAFRYTARGNLVGVVTNGTAVLGLGDIGALGEQQLNVIAVAQGSSEANISLVLAAADADAAVRYMHTAFGLAG